MIPQYLRALFWDVDPSRVDPLTWPDYSIFRVLEYGDETAVRWMRGLFPAAEIRRVLSTEHRLSARSAGFWALVYGICTAEIAALSGGKRGHVAP